MSRGWKSAVWAILLILVAVIGVASVLYFTRFGPGTSGDSVNYIMGAQNLLAGNGYSRNSGGGEIRPITGFPPLYPVFLTINGLLGLDILFGVRVLQGLLFGVNIILVGLLVHRYTRSILASAIGALLILTTQNLIYLHGWVMTEVLFIFLMLLAIYGLVWYLEVSKVPILLVTSIIIGLATLTRYVGLSLTAAGLASLLLLSTTSWKRRILDCLLLGVVSLAPVYMWLRRNASIAGTMVNRELLYHPMRADLFMKYRGVVYEWFFPLRLGLTHTLKKSLLLVVVIPTLAVYYALDFWERIVKKDRPQGIFWTLPWVLSFFILGYVGILVVNSTLLDAATTLGAPSRYLAPVYVVVVILVVIAVHRLVMKWRLAYIPRVAAVSVALLLITVNLLDSYAMLTAPSEFIGYTGFRTHRPGTVVTLKTLDQSAPIISNNPELVYILSDRFAYMRPIHFDVYSLEYREDFEQQIEATRDKLNRGGVLVIFGAPNDMDREVIDLLGVEVIDTFYGSAFYGYPGSVEE